MASGELRVLVTTADVPWPPHTGKAIRSNHLCRVASSLGSCTTLVIGAPGHGPERTTASGGGLEFALMPVGHASMPVAVGTAVRRLWPSRVAMANWSWVGPELSGRPEFDLAIFGAVEHAAILGPAVRAAHVVVDMDDIESQKALAVLRAARRTAAPRAEAVRAAANLSLWRRMERQVLRSGATLLTASELDAGRLGLPDLARVHVVPNTYPDHGVLPLRPGSTTIGLVGNFDYPPNADSAAFAVMDILPRIRATIPDARLRIIGRGSDRLPETLRAAPGVSCTGPVESVPAALDGCALSLCPVRFGGGTRIKIIEAFCLGVPAVSTTVGAEGLGAEAGADILVADTAEGLARACVSVMDDPALGATLAENGRRRYDSSFSPSVVRGELRAALLSALESRLP